MRNVRARPTLFLIAGPNGAGKTTFYDTVLRFRVAATFINADQIQRDELSDASPEAAYEAAAMATDRRTKKLAAGESFITETVFSHASKLVLLRDARSLGYRLIVFHLGLATADLAVARVQERVKEGGHTVPEHKIRARFARNQPLIREAVMMADYSGVYDASRLNQPPGLLLNLRAGSLEFCADDLPAWCRALYGEALNTAIL